MHHEVVAQLRDQSRPQSHDNRLAGLNETYPADRYRRAGRYGRTIKLPEAQGNRLVYSC